MPYKRRVRRRSRRPRRRGVRAAVKRYVARKMDRMVEDKIQYSSYTTFNSVGNTWTEVMMPMPGIGTEQGQRIGRTIRIKRIYIEAVLEGAAGSITAEPNNLMRVVIASWNGSGGSAPLASDSITMQHPIIKGLTPSFSNYVNINADLIKLYRDRKILFQSPGLATTNYIPSQKRMVFNLRFKKGKIVRFDGFGTATWKLGVHMLSDSAVIPNPGTTLFYFYMVYEDA